ncbi:MAG: HyaD/HybD family hydrogenase maturation endopeptidase [Gemmatimonadaceae bacterium]|nr:HyaD/HybD family hydrogenase maturation endopeptidase [Gemmatimonadaceae bacterium]
MPRAETHVPLAGRTAVLGLGNPLLADDALGLVALERLVQDYALDASVSVHDGGTWGMQLMPMIEDAERVLFLDAIDRHEAPGTVIRLVGDEIPATLATMISPHQLDLREVLAMTRLRGTFPSEAVAIGVQPETTETRVALSPAVAARVEDVVLAAVAQLRAWGHTVRRRASSERPVRHAAMTGGIADVVLLSGSTS